jgi:hypothetical protein
MAIIPGQSLTAEPKNAPYENAPQMTKPEEVTMWHLNRIMEPDRMEAILDSLELGLDVVTMTEGLLRAAVLDGRHSIDVSLIIAPVIHEFIKTSAERVGIDFDEGLPDNSKEKANVKYAINSKKAADMIDKLKKSGKLEEPMLEPMDDMEQAEPPMDMPEEMEAPMETPMAPQGLMARPAKGGTI